jgi:glyoxylase-like metal-dependent hydrolase (beta-lactamase superfamily II)
MKRWRIGDVTITSITEVEVAIPGATLVPDATPGNLEALGEWIRPFVDGEGNLRILIQALGIASQGRRILVDTCVGNDKERTIPAFDRLRTSFLEDLENAGFGPGAVDTVVCTHLHVDHVGWNTRWDGSRWTPTFPKARYLIAREEWEHWSREEEIPLGDILGDSVRPVFDAGLADLVATDHAITDEVRLEPTPGHTPGHVSVRIRSRGEELMITGDLMHHPSQCAHPEWESLADTDRALARRTRRAFLEHQATRGVRVIGTHFAGPCIGRVHPEGEAFRFQRDEG